MTDESYNCGKCGRAIWDILDLKEHLPLGNIRLLCSDCSKKYSIAIIKA